MLEILKELAGRAAYDYVYNDLDSAESIGLGTGSTIKYFIKRLLRDNRLHRLRVYASSLDTLLYLAEHGIRAQPPGYTSHVDLYVDGLDEVSTRLDIVKGRGAALHWEKQLALITGKRIYVADYTKYNGRPYLYMKPIPIEVSPQSLQYAMEKLGGYGAPILRRGLRKDGPVITDSGNYIIDLYADRIDEPARLDEEIRGINGVVETGLFPRSLVDAVILALPHGEIKVLEAV